MSTKFKLANGKTVSGTRFFFQGNAENFRIVRPEEIMVGRRHGGRGATFDCTPTVDPPFGAVLLIPGDPGSVWVEYYVQEGNYTTGYFREVDDCWPITTMPSREYAREILEEELATFGDPDCRWTDDTNAGLICAEEAPESRQARYEARQRSRGFKTVSVRLDAASRIKLEAMAAQHGGDQSAALRALLSR